MNRRVRAAAGGAVVGLAVEIEGAVLRSAPLVDVGALAAAVAIVATMREIRALALREDRSEAADRAPRRLVLVARPVHRGGRARRVIGWLLRAAGALGPRGLAGLAALALACAAGYAALGCWPMAAVGVVLSVAEAFLAVRAWSRVRVGGGGPR